MGGMACLKSIMTISVIALGSTLVAILADQLLGVTLAGLIPLGTDQDLQLLLLRGVECMVLSLVLIRSEQPEIRLRPILMDLAIGTLLVLGGWGFSIAIDGWLESTGRPPLFAPFKAGVQPTSTFFILAVVVGPLLEELFFRASLHRACRPEGRWEKGWLLMISSVIFAFLHLDGNRGFLVQAPLFLMWSTCGMLTMGLYMIRRSLLPGYLLHGGANAVLFFL